MNTCNHCKEKLENCICPMVAKFFKDNGHLMEGKSGLRIEQEERKKFFYVKGPSCLVSQ